MSSALQPPRDVLLLADLALEELQAHHLEEQQVDHPPLPPHRPRRPLPLPLHLLLPGEDQRVNLTHFEKHQDLQAVFFFTILSQSIKARATLLVQP